MSDPQNPTFDQAVSLLSELEAPTFNAYELSPLRHLALHQFAADLFGKPVNEVRAAVNESLEAAHHFFIHDGRVFVRCADLGRKGDILLGSVDTAIGNASLLAPTEVDWKGLSGSPALEAQDYSDARAWLESQGYQVAEL
jgi:hypothetical protein